MSDLYDPREQWASFILNAIKAKELFIRDVSYIVRANEVRTLFAGEANTTKCTAVAAEARLHGVAACGSLCLPGCWGVQARRCWLPCACLPTARSAFPICFLDGRSLRYPFPFSLADHHRG